MSTSTEVGVIRQTFRPGRINLGAGVILAVAAAGAGIFGLVVILKGSLEILGVFAPDPEKKSWDWPLIGFLAVPSIGGIVVGWFLGKWMRALMALRVEVGMLGLRITERNGSRVVLWDDITSVEEQEVYMPRKYGLPPEKSLGYIVSFHSGEPLLFGPNTIGCHILLAGMIKREIKSRAIPWIVTQHY